MRLKDDGDIIKALGFVALYSAYMEEAIEECAMIIWVFNEGKPKNFERQPVSAKIKYILDWLAEKSNLPNELSRLPKLLEYVSKLLESRHEVIHGRIYSGLKDGGDKLRPSRAGNLVRKINSHELYELAQDIFNTLSGLNNASMNSLPRFVKVLQADNKLINL